MGENSENGNHDLKLDTTCSFPDSAHGPFSTHAMVQVLAFKNTVPYCFSTEKSASVTTVIKHKLPESNDTHLTAVFSCRYFGNFIRVLGFFYLKIGKFYTFFNWERVR